ncbi:MAG: AAA family ATPase [Deltaproteobacteria bacterium]|nr:AAA family ATPase [Deltaproteobacteria bacterium]
MLSQTPRDIEQSSKIPDQKELEKELSDYLSKKYGDRVKIVSPFMIPKGHADGEKAEPSSRKRSIDSIGFDLKPEELESFLDEYIIQQDEAKAIMATKICTHFNRIKFARKTGRRGSDDLVGLIKNNIVLVGPTGVGKTYIVKLIAQRIGVPFVKGDATKFSETGYVGGDVEDLVRDLVYEADEDIDLAQYGIVYIDEIDKIASSHSLIGPDVSRSGVQRALLKLMEDTDVDLKVPHDPISQIEAIENYRKTGKREKRTVNTRNILFIVSGAFSGIEKLIKERLSKAQIGFGGEVESKEIDPSILNEVRTEDFIKYGFESEFIGRLPVVARFKELSRDDLYEILRNPNNPIIISKKRDFRAYGIDIRFEDAALKKLADMAYSEKTGARGLVSVVERALIPFEKKLPSTDIRWLLVSSELIEESGKTLNNVLAGVEDEERKSRFEIAAFEDRKALKRMLIEKKSRQMEEHGLKFTDITIDLVNELHVQLGMDINHALQEVFDMHEHVKDYEKTLSERFGFRVRFTDDAVNEIMLRAIEQDLDATEVCKYLAKEIEYGLRLVKDRTGLDEFVLTEEAVRKPEAFLSDLIKKHFSADMSQEEIQETMTRNRQADQ